MMIINFIKFNKLDRKRNRSNFYMHKIAFLFLLLLYNLVSSQPVQAYTWGGAQQVIQSVNYTPRSNPAIFTNYINSTAAAESGSGQALRGDPRYINANGTLGGVAPATCTDCIRTSVGWGHLNLDAHGKAILEQNGISTAGMSKVEIIRAADQYLQNNPNVYNNYLLRLADNTLVQGGCTTGSESCNLAAARMSYVCGSVSGCSAEKAEIEAKKICGLMTGQPATAGGGSYSCTVTVNDDGTATAVVRDTQTGEAAGVTIACPRQQYPQLFAAANTRGKQILSGEVDATHKSFKPPKIAGAYCTQILLDALDLFSALLNGSFLSIVAKAAAAIVLSIITRLAKAVCNYVVSMVNSVLALACIPIPPFDLPKFGLKGKKGYCDGLQLVGPIATPPVNLAPAFSAMTGMQVPSYYGTPSLRSLLGGTRKRTGFDLLDGFQGK